ncbi:MAG TPA: hypothetical protein VMZ66_14710 [Aeromicrobium sp.]|nr:hypothetical protein [Aeromicrobium sp.]
MKPGRRRLLIPGLLVALLIVVALAAATRRAGAETTPLPVVPHMQVSVMSDPRITESSGLAASQAHPGIVYTVNDSGDNSRIFAVDVDRGQVVGVTSITNAHWRDAEAMSVWGGKVWVADVGNNSLSRKDQALYVFDEPGAGRRRVKAARYPIAFQGPPTNVEAMAIVPGRIYFFSKAWATSVAFQLTGTLTPFGSNVAKLTSQPAPAWTSDATASADGRYVLVRGAVQVEVRQVLTWKLVHADVIPMLRQGETITLEASGRSYLIGSEGSDSPLVRIDFNPATFTIPPPMINPAVQIKAQHPLMSYVWTYSGLAVRVAPFVLALAIVVAVWWTRRRRRRRKADAEPT